MRKDVNKWGCNPIKFWNALEEKFTNITKGAKRSLRDDLSARHFRPRKETVENWLAEVGDIILKLDNYTTTPFSDEDWSDLMLKEFKRHEDYLSQMEQVELNLDSYLILDATKQRELIWKTIKEREFQLKTRQKSLKAKAKVEKALTAAFERGFGRKKGGEYAEDAVNEEDEHVNDAVDEEDDVSVSDSGVKDELKDEKLKDEFSGLAEDDLNDTFDLESLSIEFEEIC